MRKVYLEIKMKLIIQQDDDVETSEVINELDYNFEDNTGKATVLDSEMLDYEVIDSK